jgi:hypothetical protein
MEILIEQTYRASSLMDFFSYLAYPGFMLAFISVDQTKTNRENAILVVSLRHKLSDWRLCSHWSPFP